MTISPPPTFPNNVEDQSPISKPNFNIVQGGRGRGKSIFQMTLTGRHLSKVSQDLWPQLKGQLIHKYTFMRTCERANVQRNVGKAARLINRRTYLRTEKRCEDVTLGRDTIVRT